MAEDVAHSRQPRERCDQVDSMAYDAVQPDPGFKHWLIMPSEIWRLVHAALPHMLFIPEQIQFDACKTTTLGLRARVSLKASPWQSRSPLRCATTGPGLRWGRLRRPTSSTGAMRSAWS